MLGSRILSTANPDRPAGFSFEQDPPVVRYTLPRPALAGNTSGPDLITTPGAFQTTSSDGPCCQKGNGFVVKIASAAPVIALSTAGQAQVGLFEQVIDLIRKDINDLPEDSISVREKWREKRAAAQPETLKAFHPATVALLRGEIAPLMRWRNIRGLTEAFEFDLLLTRMEQERLKSSSSFDELRTDLLGHLVVETLQRLFDTDATLQKSTAESPSHRLIWID